MANKYKVTIAFEAYSPMRDSITKISECGEAGCSIDKQTFVFHTSDRSLQNVLETGKSDRKKIKNWNLNYFQSPINLDMSIDNEKLLLLVYNGRDMGSLWLDNSFVYGIENQDVESILSPELMIRREKCLTNKNLASDIKARIRNT